MKSCRIILKEKLNNREKEALNTSRIGPTKIHALDLGVAEVPEFEGLGVQGLNPEDVKRSATSYPIYGQPPRHYQRLKKLCV